MTSIGSIDRTGARGSEGRGTDGAVGSLLRLYDESECKRDGYPFAWNEIKDYVREQAGHRCVRCGHPYRSGAHGNGEWSSCDEQCEHEGPVRFRPAALGSTAPWTELDLSSSGHTAAEARLDEGPLGMAVRYDIEARWRILTVHHLTGDWANTQAAKRDCRWWNLASLCQRCHLLIQGKVQMERAFILEHSPWFRPFACGWYAWKYEGREITREEAAAREDELLAYERLA